MKQTKGPGHRYELLQMPPDNKQQLQLLLKCQGDCSVYSVLIGGIIATTVGRNSPEGTNAEVGIVQ